jgi:prepilin-type N-terminal cleavage/methylation domain-containing protein
MPISARSKTEQRKSLQHGLTLIELLITLSILSLGALIAAGGINRALPQRAVDFAAEQLVSDLKRARLEAKKTGAPVTVSFSADGYAAPGLFDRNFDNGVALQLDGNSGDIVFDLNFASLGGAVTLGKGRRQAIVKVHAITGKVERAG